MKLAQLKQWGWFPVVACLLGVVVHNLGQADAVAPTPIPRAVMAQGGPTWTPAPAQNLPTQSPTNVPPSETPSRTPTDQGAALAEAKNPDANVRSGAGTDYDRLGQIDPGTRFKILGKYIEWYQIEYPDTPTRIGWVHNSVVNVIGDVNSIPDLDPALIETLDPTIGAGRETAMAATQTPGGVLTLRAQTDIPQEAAFTITPQVGIQLSLAPGQRLPTFTFPAFTPTPIKVQDLRAARVENVDENEAFPPIIPITGLAAAGLLGLFFAILRRF